MPTPYLRAVAGLQRADCAIRRRQEKPGGGQHPAGSLLMLAPLMRAIPGPQGAEQTRCVADIGRLIVAASATGCFPW